MEQKYHLTARERAIIENLSLRLQKSNSPFALDEKEEKFRPEDWAWQFLRLNENYNSGYKRALEQGTLRRKSDRHFTDGSMFANKRPPWKALLESESLCRKEFGISTWLNPSNKILPPLSDDESWFFPLAMTFPISESFLGAPISKNVFGYGDPRASSTPKKDVRLRNYDNHSSAVWFIVDCAVPIESQILSIKVVARMYREWLKNHCPDSRRPVAGSKALKLEDCRVWHRRKKSSSSISMDKNDKAESQWRAICIDVLSPIVEQLNKYTPELQTEHKKLCIDGEVESPFRQRNLRTTKTVSDGIVLTDGHVYKCLVMVGQMTKVGLDPAQIENVIWNYAETSNRERTPWSDWIDDREVRIAQYVKMADEFIEKGYRWLVQAQKSA